MGAVERFLDTRAKCVEIKFYHELTMHGTNEYLA